ncbi:DUF732 domain-containing protein [Antrihabitans stalactiti]|uniref:DUF732 domain-containing protein n=1 Tax=Antrihabitans stalactiti TaxID=2584121 RepID=A0A848K6V3_9NOCA|nr:DUF732 domain-containing protein [Antrihabitans stalactiti]NMN94745.1 DUF732 domain-containing protein [Antrihabitans stalactiti]
MKATFAAILATAAIATGGGTAHADTPRNPAQDDAFIAEVERAGFITFGALRDISINEGINNCDRLRAGGNAYVLLMNRIRSSNVKSATVILAAAANNYCPEQRDAVSAAIANTY